MWALALPIAEGLSLSLWDIRFVSEGGERYLRFFIDKAGGVFIDDCERFHRAIDPVLDEEDPIDTAYILEVSSPGLDRELTRPEHFEKYQGEKVTLKLFKAYGASKKISGKLISYDGDNVIVNISGEDVTFTRQELSKVIHEEEINF